MDTVLHNSGSRNPLEMLGERGVFRQDSEEVKCYEIKNFRM
jgi:hypothetical protein